MADVAKIKPGSKVQVKIVAHPTNISARKTLIRLLYKDEVHAAEEKRLTRIRHKMYSPRRRGGRLYSGRMPKLRRLKGEIGESGTILATMDVIRDLRSVSRFVEVS